MTAELPDSSLRLRIWSSLVLFISAYSPLLLILVVQDIDPAIYQPKHPVMSGLLVLIAGLAVITVLRAVGAIDSGLTVEIVKAANKSGEMFGYTIPYVLSFMKVDLGSWQMIICLIIFLAMQFTIAYRTQTVFVNPILAIAGYMLIDCTFKRGTSEIQAMVVTRHPLSIGQSIQLERLSHYLYVAIHEEEPIS